MSDLFVPDRIRVGFQNRDDTYTKQLAYIVYYDKKGKLRKEKSWETWRHKDIEPAEFDNAPQDGFILNKGMTRYAWSSFGSDRTIIRVYDSRGIEFEITLENLVGILTETDCFKRGLDGKFVYAWAGTELVLLPCCSEEYKKAVEYTALQGQKISARDLKPGCSYTTKKGEEVIYMGRFPWFVWNGVYTDKVRISQKKHIFAKPEKPEKDEWRRHHCRFFAKSDAAFLAVLNSEDAVQNYAALVDEFNGDLHSSIIEKWETKPLVVTHVFDKTSDRYATRLKRPIYTEIKGVQVIFWELSLVERVEHLVKVGGPETYRIQRVGTLDTKNLKYSKDTGYDQYWGRYGNRYSHYRDRPASVMTKEQVLERFAAFVEVSMVLTSGKKLHMKRIDSLVTD